jgi:hypothetical protein
MEVDRYDRRALRPNKRGQVGSEPAAGRLVVPIAYWHSVKIHKFQLESTSSGTQSNRNIGRFQVEPFLGITGNL